MTDVDMSTQHMNGHMPRTNNFDNPVDLTNGKMVKVNGCGKAEGQYDADKRHQSHYSHNGVSSTVTVGIPDQSHGKIRVVCSKPVVMFATTCASLLHRACVSPFCLNFVKYIF